MIKLIWSYTVKNYRKNLAIVMVLSISICVIFANATAKKSQVEFAKQAMVKNRPKAEVIYDDLNEEQLEKISQNGDVASYTKIRSYGSVTYLDRLTENLIDFNQEYFNQYKLTLVDGSLPKNKNEVIIFEDEFKKLGLELGQTIDLKGSNSFHNEDGIDVENYSLAAKVVGYYTCPEVMKTFYIDSAIMLAPGHDDLIKVKSYKGTIDFKEGLKAYSASMKPSSDLNVNSDHIYMDDTISRLKSEEAALSTDKDSTDWAFMVLGAFMTINMISLMASQISRDQGLLRIIAMSRRRILLFEFLRNSFLFLTATLLGLVMSLPLTRLFTRRFIYSSINVNMKYAPISYDWVCMKNVIILLALVMVVSVAIPSMNVFSRTPMDQYRGIKGKKWAGFSSNFINRIFKSIENRLLVTSILNQRVFVIVSAVIILFAGHTYVHNYSYPESWNHYSFPLQQAYRDYDIRLSENRQLDNFRAGYTDEDVKKISSIKGVKDVFARSKSKAYMYVEPGNLSKEYKAQRLLDDNLSRGELRFDLIGMSRDLMQDFVDKDKVLESGRLPSDKVEDGVVEGLVYNMFYLKMDERGDFKVIKNLSLGDIIKVRMCVYDKATDRVTYREQKIRVVGLLGHTWGSFFDTEAFVPDILMNSKAYNKVSGSEYFSRIEVRTKSEADTNRIFKDIKASFSDKIFLSLETLKGIVDDSERFFRVEKKKDFVTALILFGLAITNIVVGILLSFEMRKNEYGSLLSLGMRRNKLKGICVKNTVLVVIPGIIGLCVWTLYDAIENFDFTKMCAVEQGIPFNESLYIPWLNLGAFILACVICMLVTGFALARKVDRVRIMDMISRIE